MNKTLNSLLFSKSLYLTIYKGRFAFTLAEILITLLIIGIVASLVIPGLIADTQKQEDYTRLLKAVSVIQNAANLIRVENGGRMAGLTNTSLNFANLFAAKMNYIKFCKNQTDSENCYIKNSDDMYNLHGEPLGSASPYMYSSLPKIISNDGFLYFFQLTSSSCEGTHYKLDGVPKTCGVVFVDINGKKTPNTWGKDIFLILVNDSNIIVYGNPGGPSPSSECRLSNTADIWNGGTCAGRAIQEGGIKYY